MPDGKSGVPQWRILFVQNACFVLAVFFPVCGAALTVLAGAGMLPDMNGIFLLIRRLILTASLLSMVFAGAFIFWLQAVWQNIFPEKRTRIFHGIGLLAVLGCVCAVFMAFPGRRGIFTAAVASGEISAWILFCVCAEKRGFRIFLLSLVCAMFGTAGVIGRMIRFRGPPAGDDPGLTVLSVFYAGSPDFYLVCSGLAVILFLLLVPAVSGVKMNAAARWESAAFAGTCAFSAVLAFGVMNFLDRRTDSLAGALQESYGVPLTREALRKLYFHGNPPDPVWTSLVNRLQKFDLIFDKQLWDNVGPLESNLVLALRSGVSRECILLRVFQGKLGSRLENGTLPPDELVLLRNVLESSRAELAEIDSIFDPAGKDFPKYEVDFSRPVSGEILPHLNCFRAIQRLNADRIALALHDGRREAALGLYFRAGKLSRTAFDELSLIGSLAGISCEAIRLDALQRILGSGLLSADDLSCIETDLESMEPAVRRSMMRGYFHETAMLIDSAGIVLCGSAHPETAHSLLRCAAGAPVYSYLKYDLNSGLMRWSEFYRLVLKEGHSPAEGRVGAVLEPERRLPLCGMLLPAVGKAWEKVVSLEARLRMARTACRIERFRLETGRLPETLSELAGILPDDPFCGMPFRYSAEGPGEGCRLWGIGPDGLDGGGLNPREDDLFRVPRKLSPASGR